MRVNPRARFVDRDRPEAIGERPRFAELGHLLFKLFEHPGNGALHFLLDALLLTVQAADESARHFLARHAEAADRDAGR